MVCCLVAFALFTGIIPPLPEDLDKSYNSLKEAVAQSDPDLVKNLAVESATRAQKIIAQVPPLEDEQDKLTWTKQVEYAKSILGYTEFALADSALKAKAPAATVDLLATLERQNPASKYLDEAYARYFVALRQTGGTSKIPEVAANALKHFPNNEDLLLVLADDSLNRKQIDRALTYSERLVTALERHSKPEAMAAADWERKRSLSLTRGHWIAGITNAERGHNFEADKHLRAALSGVRGDSAMLAPALFYLGLANYQLGSQALDRARVLEAADFSDQCAKIKSAYSEKAWQNANAMREQAAKMTARRR